MLAKYSFFWLSGIFWTVVVLAQSPRLSNLKHLDFLNQVGVRQGEKILLTHIYCEYPHYQRVNAVGEGVACVDDVARAAIVYLKHFQYYRNEKSLAKARMALNFVMQMQAPDGEFYNFVYANLSINKTGQTSRKSIGFWAARGLWALSCGYTIFKDKDRDYANRLRRHILKGIGAVKRFIEQHKETKFVGFTRLPRWMIIRGSDCWSIFLLGLVEFYQHHRQQDLHALLLPIGDAIANYQHGDFRTFPFNAHLSCADPHLWHGWGNRQTQALCYGYRILKRKKWLISAVKEAAHFYTYLLASRMLGGMKPQPVIYQQIAYTVSPIVAGLLELSTATGEEHWARLAGLAGGWFFGNNPHQFPMYDPSTGRCFDGIGANSVNLHSGAESTIEALLAILELERHPVAKEYLYLRPISVNSSQLIEIVPGQKRAQFFLAQAGRYYIFLHLCDKSLQIQVDHQNPFQVRGSDYPTLWRISKTFKLPVGIHTISWKPGESTSYIVVQPVVESKVFMARNKTIVLIRDWEQGETKFCEGNKHYSLGKDQVWKP